MPLSTKSCHVPAADAGRADLIVQKLTGLPRRQIRGLFDHGCVLVNGQVQMQTFARVGQGDLVEVKFNREQVYHEKPKTKPDAFFTVVFEDEHIIVVDKAAGILTVPKAEPDGDEHTLMARVSLHVTRGMARDRAYPCHRLDRGVSGLLVVAKSAAIAAAMRNQFEAHKPRRVYFAIINGQPGAKQGTFRSYLATGGNLDRYSTQDPKRDKGQLAITHFKVERRLGSTTMMRVELETGRRNQIRVHFAEAGHPVLGDERYEAELARHPRWKQRRLALHAAELGFDHPVTNQPMKFQSPLPDAMQRFVNGSRSAPVDEQPEPLPKKSEKQRVKRPPRSAGTKGGGSGGQRGGKKRRGR
ncbi:MAG: RluA family pseudouridine synthase [Phycisphaeraceae bacterium]